MADGESSRSTIYLKMRRVGSFIILSVPRSAFLKVQLVPKPLTCPGCKYLLGEPSPLDHQIVGHVLLPLSVFGVFLN